MENSAPRIALIVLTYRFPEITLRCLESISKNVPDAFTLFLVNNSPEDGSAELLQKGLAATGMDYRYLESPGNLGFSGGMNLGMRRALKDGFSHMALLNNDTVVDPDFGERLREEVRSHPYEVLAGLIVDPVSRKPTYNIGNLSRWTFRVEHIFRRDYGADFDFVSGCFVVFPSQVLKKIGLLREDYFMYAEDTELCIRLTKAGVKILYCPSIVVAHTFGSSADRSRVPKEYYLTRNHTHLVFLHGSPLQKLVYASFLTKLVLNQIRHPERISQIVPGILDAIRGRMGQRSKKPELT